MKKLKLLCKEFFVESIPLLFAFEDTKSMPLNFVFERGVSQPLSFEKVNYFGFDSSIEFNLSAKSKGTDD